MTDFRALCAELLELEQPAEYTDWKRRYNAAMARTRTALSQPEPVAPTDEEIEEWADAGAFASDTRACILELRARVETLEKRCEVLQDRHHRLTLRVGHLEHDLYRDDDDEPQQHCLEAMDPPEANSQPEPQGPTDEELDELWAEIDGGGAIWAWQYFARAVLARWGTPANNTKEEILEVPNE